ncbi:MAG: aminotransferase class IV [Chitinophagaceae bacterium]
MSIFFNCNGRLYKDGTAIFTTDNRSFRYGDGLFETLKLRKAEIVRGALHFERLFSGLTLMRFNIPAHFTPAFLINEILQLAAANKHLDLARVRLTVYRGDGGLYDFQNHLPRYLIQTWPLADNVGEWNQNGLITEVFPDAHKPCDLLANIKSNNFLPYALAAVFAKQYSLNDAIILNTNGRVCDSSIANIFMVKDGIIYTPPLSEGCIAGVFRKMLLHRLPEYFDIRENSLTIADLESADEIFLTNSIHNIRWVKSFGQSTYGHELAFKIYLIFQATI